MQTKYLPNIRSAFLLLIWVPVLVIPLLHTNSTIDANIHIRFVALGVYLLLLCVFAFFILRQKGVAFFSGDVIFIFFIAYAAFSVPGCFLSPFASGDSLFEWMKLILLPSCTLLMTFIFSHLDDFMHELSKSITLLVSIVLFYGIVQFAGVMLQSGISHQTMYTVKSTFAHKNIFSEILLFLMPFSLFCFLSMKDLWRWLGTFSLFFSTAFIVVLMTRAVWIAFACSVLSVLLLYFALNIRKKALRIDKKIIAAAGVLLLVALLSIIIYDYYDQENTFVKQLSNIFNFHYGSTGERVMLWKNSLQTFRDHPFFGAGMGKWQVEILKYGGNGLASEETTTFYQRPHNDLIWILAEQGIFAFLMYLAIIVMVFHYIIRMIQASQYSEGRTFFYLLFFGLTGYFIFSLFSFPKERAEHLLFLSFYIAAVLIYKQKVFPLKNDPEKNNFTLAILLLTVLIGIFALTISAMRLRSEKYLALAFNARQAGDWKTMITDLDLAESPVYHIDPVSTPLRWYRGLANFNLNHIQDALFDFKEAYSYNPYHVHVLNNLGTCYEMTGNHAQAMEYFQKTIDLSRSFDEVKFNLCASAYNAGNPQKAYSELRKINREKSLEKYDHFLNFVLASVIKAMRDTTDEGTKIQIDRVLNSQEWVRKIHFKSIENNISFEKQLILDLAYSLEVIDKDSTEARRIKTKYSSILN